MSRYIDADALKAFIRNQYFQCDMPEEWGNGVMWATSQINHYCNKVASSIDIVRCKECRYYKQSEAFCEHGNGLWQAGDECFCNYGDRKESE